MSAAPRGRSRVLVLDIGKTNAKAALVDLEEGREREVLTAPNRVLPGPPYPHFDSEALHAFALGAIRDLHARHGVEALTLVGHGSAAALVDAEGRLALPPLDYEHAGPEETAAAYDALRPPFAETGSPRLPLGLNLGAQLFWQARRFPEAFARTAAILPWPQYWALRLSGVAATETTSLGCHTDLWRPAAGAPSGLVERMGWTGLLPPLRCAADALGPVLPDVAAATGLDPSTPVHCGLHDSNASLAPHLLGGAAPFAVVSTGTWVISMAVGGAAPALDPARDTLMNVDAFGAPTPSARFMGGREREVLLGPGAPPPGPADIAAALIAAAIPLPAVEPRSGPFPGRAFRWDGGPEPRDPGTRAAAVAFYLALMTAEGLALIGAAGPVTVEGPLAADPAFCAMLAAGAGRPVLAAAGATGTAVGAALLLAPDPARAAAAFAPRAQVYAPDPVLAARAAAWRAAVAARV